MNPKNTPQLSFRNLALILSLAMGLLFCRAPKDSADRETALLLTLLSLTTDRGVVYSKDGTPLYYRKVGTGTPVLVLHGGPGLDHNYLVEPLAETIGSGKQLVFFDQRGTGFSGGNFRQIGANFINKDKFLEDLDAIRTGLGLGETIHILGHSWGGLYALLYATDDRYRSHVRSLALVGSSGANGAYYNAFLTNVITRAGGLQNALPLFIVYRPPLDPNSTSYQPSLQALREYYGFLFKFYFADYSAPGTNSGTSAHMARLHLGSSTEKTIRHGLAVADLLNSSLGFQFNDQGMAVSAPNFFPLLGRITAPVLIVHGDQDVMPKGYAITGESSSIQAGLTQSSQVRAVEIANSGHFPFIERPTEFRQAFQNFY